MSLELDPGGPYRILDVSSPHPRTQGGTPDWSFLGTLLSSSIAISFSTTECVVNLKHKSTRGGPTTLHATIELSSESTSRAPLDFEQRVARSQFTRLSHGRGEQVLSDLLSTSCKVVEALGERHSDLADQLATSLVNVTKALARKVGE